MSPEIMHEFDVALTKTVRGTVVVRGDSFAEAEKQAHLSSDVEWEIDEAFRDIEQITKR